MYALGDSSHIVHAVRDFLLMSVRFFRSALLVLVTLTCANFTAAQGSDELYWFNNYAAAMREARATGKPIFLVYRCAP